MKEFFPVSTSNFERIIKEGFHYVDKSMMIKDIVECGQGAFLFTRPRRFGKTLNLDMLESFFNMDRPNGEMLFSKLKISKYPHIMSQLGKYKVIHLDFSSIESANLETFKDCFSSMISDLINKNIDLIDYGGITERDRRILNKLLYREADESDLRKSISFLCGLFKTAYGVETVILIDEYDKPFHKAYMSGFYDDCMELMVPFMESILKTNPYYKFAVITGVSRISKETIFSGVNNLQEFDIFRDLYDEYFGFTEDEVRELITDAGLSDDEMGLIRDYYDGYRFGNKDIYNPYSVMRYLSDYVRGDKEPKDYWIQSGNTSLISDTIVRTSPAFKDRILSLGTPGNHMDDSIEPHLSFGDLFSKEESILEKAVITLMVTSGYLKAVPIGDKMYRMTVPNIEVLEGYDGFVKRMYMVDRHSTSKLIDLIFMKDSEKATKELNRLLDGQSPRDSYDERVHKTFLSALFSFSGFRYQTELGSGDGFIDLYIKGRNGMPGLLMELKYSDEKCDLDSLSKEALNQIIEKEYSRNIDETHLTIGIAFRKHTAKIIFSDTVIR